MNRRAWIMGGTLASGAAVCSALYMHSRRMPELSRAMLSNHSGPFALPKGFEAKIISRAGDRLSDGSRSADLPDGMACFSGPDGKWVLLRNHELTTTRSQGAYPNAQPGEAYDPNAVGGVSRLVIDPESLDVVSSNMVLTGTLRNCAGGPCPWGWITCEEATDPGHGYAFLCRTGAEKLSRPEILRDYGRFRHEAVAFDPATHCAYLTEDEGDGALYRFTPRRREAPFEGKLEALRVVGSPGHATTNEGKLGKALPIDWVTVDDPESAKTLTRVQAQKKGAALFSRGEGAWWDGDGVVFTATSGGPAGRGQVFRVDTTRMTLTLVAVSSSDEDFNGPDNITVAPWGDFIVAEDGPGPSHVYGVRRNGRSYPVLRNQTSASELCGVCFSPDGNVLFVNVQWDGLTVAVRGPFQEFFARG